MPDRPPFPPRPAQPPGETHLSFTPDGRRLNVAGLANFARSYVIGSTDEPAMMLETMEEVHAMVSGNDFLILGGEDGAVTEYEVPSGKIKQMLYSSSLPIRDLAKSRDESWIVVSSDEVEVKLVNRRNTEEILTLTEHPKPIKHLSFSPDGRYLACSCTDGKIYVYQNLDKLESMNATLVRTIDGVVARRETTDSSSSKCFWHPDSRTFACATPTHDIQVVSISDGAMQRVFKSGHAAAITSLAWSPNGALVASGSSDDDALCIWQTSNQQLLKKYNYEKVLHVAWHPSQNLLAWTTDYGECCIIPNFLREESHIKLLNGPAARSPFFHDPIDEQRKLTNGFRDRKRQATPDSLDELLGPDPDAIREGEDDWIVDDDNAGYTNGNGKRPAPDRVNGFHPPSKRSRYISSWAPNIHPPIQHGATPYRGNRRYLTLTLLGFIWTVDHDTHHTITVEFYDRERFRDFHFTDYFGYDKACLAEHGALFSAPTSESSRGVDGQQIKAKGGVVFYRPHETWVGRSDAASRIELEVGEEAVALALGRRNIVAVTNKGYVRVWTLFGTPVRIWRIKSGPVVGCAAFGDYVMTVSNGSVGADGNAALVYSIDDLRNDETLQNEDTIGLEAHDDEDEEDEDGESDFGSQARMRSIFWSDEGDPVLYDSHGVLLTLLHWRSPGQAKWVPLLDTRRLDRLRSGKKEEWYWPVAVGQERFHCVILKGGDKTPYFPRPLVSEFEFCIPVTRNVDDDAAPPDADGEGAESNAKAGARLDESFVRSSLLLGLLQDGVQYRGAFASHTDKTEVARREIEADKLLLQLLAVECREGEERGMKALEMVKLLRDRTGRMVEAAGKVAQRWGFGVLEDKVREVAERRVQGVEEEDEL